MFHAQTQGSVGLSQLFNSDKTHIGLRTGTGTKHKQNIPFEGEKNFEPAGTFFF